MLKVDTGASKKLGIHRRYLNYAERHRNVLKKVSYILLVISGALCIWLAMGVHIRA